MGVWRIFKYFLVGMAVLVFSGLLVVALGIGQFIWAHRPHARMTSTSPNGVAKVTMIENHKLADTGVRILLDRDDFQTELLYGEDCWPEFIHFSWSSDSQRVVIAWRDGLCKHSEQPILKAWNVVSGDEIPVDESLRDLLAHDIRETYPQTKSISSREAFEWAISGSDRLAWHRANPEPFWVCPWC